MNESHFTFSVNGKLYSKWAQDWAAIKAEHSTAVLIMQAS